MHAHHRYARLARESDILPWRGRLFGRGSDVEGFEIVDTYDGFTLSLIADGSLIYADPAPAQAPAALLPSDR